MPDIYKIGSKWMVEDGKGGFKEASGSDFLQAKVELPKELADKVASDQAEYDVQRAIREGKVKPGSVPQLPLNEMGVSLGQRMVIKNLASSPDAAKRYLTSLGYDVRDYGGGFNFAVRKGAGQPWRLVDPRGGKDIAFDLMDLTSDAISGTLTAAAITAAAPGGPVGQMGAGAAVSGGLEAGREKLGEMAGIPGNVQAKPIMLAGMAGAAVPGLSALRAPAKYGLDKMTNAALDLSAKIVGTDKDTLVARAAIKGFGKQETPDVVARRIRQTLQDFTDDLLPEKKEAMAIIAQADKNGSTVDMSGVMDRIKQFISPSDIEAARASLRQPSINAVAAKVYSRANRLMEVANVTPDKMPIGLAENMKQDLQHIATLAKAYEDVPIDKPIRDVFGSAAKMARQQIETVADASGVVGPTTAQPYSDLMAKLSSSMEKIKAARQVFEAGKTELGKQTRAESAVKKVWGETGSEYIDIIRDIDKMTGSNLAEAAHKAAVGEAFGDQGAVRLIPRFTAQGTLLGPSIFYGGGAAALATGQPSALLGVAAGSPLTNIAAIKAGLAAQNFGKILAPTMAKVGGSQTARSAIQSALQDLVTRSGQ